MTGTGSSQRLLRVLHCPHSAVLTVLSKIVAALAPTSFWAHYFIYKRDWLFRNSIALQKRNDGANTKMVEHPMNGCL
jgi:hypothetical protein